MTLRRTKSSAGQADSCSSPGERTSERRASDSGRFAYGLDRLFHERARLSILTSLYTHAQGLLFGEIKTLCSLTDGNLSRHLQTLSDANLVELWKNTDGPRPQTLCRLSGQGRKRFGEYLHTLERVVRDAAETTPDAETRETLPPGWIPA